MKKQIILLTITVMSFCKLSYSQSITIRSLYTSPFKWPGDIRFNNNIGIRTTIQDSKVEAAGHIEFINPEVVLNDATLTCGILRFAATVTTILISGTVKISCENIDFTGPPALILIDKLGSGPAVITIEYSGNIIPGRDIQVANADNLKVNFNRVIK